MPVASETSTVRTYCIMCSQRCPVVCTVERGRLTRVTPDSAHPLGGTFCAKGAAAPELVYDPARLKYPMKRTNPKTAADPGWVRISWEEAMQTVATKLLDIRSRHGAEAVAYTRPAAGGSASSDYQAWLLRLFFAFGSPNLVTATYICNWHKDEGSRYTYGVGIPEGDYPNSGCILVWGTNPNSTSIRHAADMEKAVKRGARLVIVDPKEIPLSHLASAHLKVLPGSDLALVMGLLHQVLEQKLYDEGFVRRWTNAAFLVKKGDLSLLKSDEVAGGELLPKSDVVWDDKNGRASFYDKDKVSFGTEPEDVLLDGASVVVQLRDGRKVECTTVLHALRQAVSGFTLEKTSSETSVPAQQIQNMVDLITRHKPLSYYTYNGIEQHADAMQTNRALCILYALMGDFDRRGGMVIYPDLPWRGGSSLNMLPLEVQKRRLGGPSQPLGPPGLGIGSWASARAVPPYEFYNAILTGKPYPMKALVSFGGNMIVANPDTQRGVKALQALEFHVHLDMYENPTGHFADILLPVTSPWESECLGKVEWRDKANVQMRRRVVPPEFERRSDLEIIFELAVRLGLGKEFFGGDLEAAFDFMVAPLGKTAKEIRGLDEGLTVSLAAEYENHKAEKDGTPAGFDTPSRLIEIYSSTFALHGYDPLPMYRDPPERQRARGGYDLLFTAFKPVVFTHGSYRSLPSLRKAFPQPTIFIHPVTAARYGVSDGEWATIESPKGSVRMVARLDKGLNPAVVIGEEGWWQGCSRLEIGGYDPFEGTGSNLNIMIDEEFIDPVSGSIAMRGVPCRISPASGPPAALPYAPAGGPG